MGVKYITFTLQLRRGTRWRSWLRHCATNREVSGSISDGVIGIFNSYNPSSRTMVLASTQPLKEKSYQEYFVRSKSGRCVGLTTLPPSCADCREIWEPQPPGTLRTCPGLYWDCVLRYELHHLQSHFLSADIAYCLLLISGLLYRNHI
jgi:hypothetical protein